ncbi:MAG: site-specific DNA-methyltransferase [Cenarchaeum sp. SB0678_bin_8]|nr:site-specific DNA-methyltransferase [Cenarchaeum sp. SB0666_bin_15]MYD58065.1 site-specific DNA-methyltransferase [Cenarchaeum sp. SB0678_bin_8]
MCMAQLFCQSSERMEQVDDDSVSLTVTSPPYWNAIDYNAHVGDSQSWYRDRKYAEGFDDYDSYLDLMQRIFGEVLRVTKPGGFCAVVIGTVLMKGTHIPAPFDLVTRLMHAGWFFHQDIVWHKTTAGVRRAGVAIRKPYPGYYYPNIMTEYIMIFRKFGTPIYKQAYNNREQSRFEIDDVFKMDVANNVWHIAPVPPNMLDHPCPFPEEIPYRLIRIYSYRGDVVLDPFCGSGQTAKVAVALGRHSINYDIKEDYINYAQSRISTPLKIRPRQLVARFEKVFANAPPTGAQSQSILSW